MKRVIGLAVLMMTGLAAFAAPMMRPIAVEKTAIVERAPVRKPVARNTRGARFHTEQVRGRVNAVSPGRQASRFAKAR